MFCDLDRLSLEISNLQIFSWMSSGMQSYPTLDWPGWGLLTD